MERAGLGLVGDCWKEEGASTREEAALAADELDSVLEAGSGPAPGLDRSLLGLSDDDGGVCLAFFFLPSRVRC